MCNKLIGLIDVSISVQYSLSDHTDMHSTKYSSHITKGKK